MGQCLEPRGGCEGEAGGQALLPRRGEAQCHLVSQPAVSPGDHGQLIRNIQSGNGSIVISSDTFSICAGQRSGLTPGLGGGEATFAAR